MKSKRIFYTGVGLTAALLLALMAGLALAQGPATSPAGTAFTFQGQLQSGGAPVNDHCDFEFSLWDAAGSGTPPTGGNQVGATQPAANIPVSNGLFAVRLDFGSGAFTGEARWLQTAVRCPAGGGSYTVLAPRQALTPVPYALFSQDLSLPFQKWVASPLNAFSVGNEGSGGAGVFEIADPANTSAALKAHSRGTGPALAAFAWNDADAFWAHVNGTGDAVTLRIVNPNNTANLINASTDGLGAGASIRIENPLNNQPAVYASTDGSGSAGSFRADGTAPALVAWSNGTGRALEAEIRGTGGATFLKIDNPGNTGSLINASTNGLGSGASIRINNPLNNQPAVYAATDGSGSAIKGHAYGSGEAIAGWSFGSNWAATFHNEGSGGGVRISSSAGTTGLSVVGGSKNAVVPTSEGARLLYSEESSAVWFSDYGFGHLSDGSVFIAVDPLFAETVNLDEPYHVFIQPYGDAELYVSQRTPLGFEVRLRAGDPEVEFSYRLVAARRGYEGKRLERAAWAEDDSNLYPALPAEQQKGGAE